MSPQARARAERMAEKLFGVLPLNKLRVAWKMTWKKLAGKFSIK